MIRNAGLLVGSVVLLAAWAAVGFFASFALIYGFTFVGPMILLTTWVAYLGMPRIAGRRFPEAFGALAGFGAFWLFVASTIDGNSQPMVLVGLGALAVAVTCYLAAGRRRCAEQAA